MGCSWFRPRCVRGGGRLLRKARDEAMLEEKVKQDAKLAPSIGDPWGDIERAEAAGHAISLPYTFLESGAGFNSRLFRAARTLVRGAVELPKNPQ